MATRKLLSPTEFVRNYTPITGSYIDRLVHFLIAAAEELPYRFFSPGVCAKIALGLSRIPTEGSDDYKRFKSVLSSAGHKIRKSGKAILTDRIEGYRATVDDEDIVGTVRRKKSRRVILAVAGLKQVDDLVNPANVKNPELKKELLTSRKAIGLLETAMIGLPQLPPKKSES